MKPIVQVIVEARDFAVRAHGSQKYGDLPYVVHLDEVADIALAEYFSGQGLREELITVAFIHDVLEDTQVKREAIESRFGSMVAKCASDLSDPPGKNRRERKALLHALLAKVDQETPGGRIVLAAKACDRLANLVRSVAGSPSLLEMYRAEAAAFREAAFRPGLCESVWHRIDAICPP